MRVNHVRQGGGEPLLLVHGIGHRWQAWLPVLGRLSEHHEVIAIDLPGFGGSPVPPEGIPRGMPAALEMLGAFLAAEGLERPHVAGYSLGGAIALEMAVAGLARSATAFCPAGFYTAAERRRAAFLLKTLRAGAFLPEPLIRRTMRVEALRALCFASLLAHPRRLDPERALEDTLALRRGRGFNQVARYSRRYRFGGAPQVPVTVGWGTHDRILQPRQAERARRCLPQARHLSLPGCGHVPMSDDPELVARIILETTGAVEPAGRRTAS